MFSCGVVLGQRVVTDPVEGGNGSGGFPAGVSGFWEICDTPPATFLSCASFSFFIVLSSTGFGGFSFPCLYVLWYPRRPDFTAGTIKRSPKAAREPNLSNTKTESLVNSTARFLANSAASGAPFPRPRFTAGSPRLCMIGRTPSHFEITATRLAALAISKWAMWTAMATSIWFSPTGASGTT